MPTLIIVFLFIAIVLAILALINRPPGAQIVFLAVAVFLLALVMLLGHYGGRLGVVTADGLQSPVPRCTLLAIYLRTL